MSLSYFFYGVTSTFLVVLRSVETVNVSVAIYGVSFAVNVFFNYVFIFGKFGAPRMGVAGAAPLFFTSSPAGGLPRGGLGGGPLS